MRQLFVLVLLMVVAANVRAADTEHFAIVSNGETVGHVTAARDGHTIDVDYAISDNGRGPKHKEHLVLDPAGIPVEWSIEGTSLMGGAVSEGGYSPLAGHGRRYGVHGASGAGVICQGGHDPRRSAAHRLIRL